MRQTKSVFDSIGATWRWQIFAKEGLAGGGVGRPLAPKLLIESEGLA